MNDSTTPLWLQVPEPSDLVKAFGSADEAAKELLGLDEIVSDATVRRAFKRGSERELDEWLSRHAC